MLCRALSLPQTPPPPPPPIPHLQGWTRRRSWPPASAPAMERLRTQTTRPRRRWQAAPQLAGAPGPEAAAAAGAGAAEAPAAPLLQAKQSNQRAPRICMRTELHDAGELQAQVLARQAAAREAHQTQMKAEGRVRCPREKVAQELHEGGRGGAQAVGLGGLISPVAVCALG